MAIFNELFQRAQAEQQNFYELSSDWNVYKEEEQIHLYNYIGYALYGPPEPPEVEEFIESDKEIGLFIYKQEKAKKIESLIKRIIEFRFSNKNQKKPSCDDQNNEIYCVALYNIIFADKETISKLKQNEQEKSPNSEENPLESLIRNIMTVVIFKFIVLENGKDSCWFMDVDERIYKNWNDYIANNKLPKCTMVLPKDGKYQPDPSVAYSNEETSVLIECHQSPACNPNKWVSRLNTVSTLGNLGAIAITGVSVLTPVAPVALTAALVTAVTTGVWGIGRSSANLVDRSRHKESLVTKKTAADWLTIGSSTIGILSIGASKALSKAIEKGMEIGKTSRYLHDSIAGGNILMNGATVTYRSFDIYTKKRKIEKSDIFFLACELFFLCNSVVNMNTAKNIIKTQEKQMLDEYKNSLRSNRHRQAFKKLTKDADSSTEIIREINKIDQKNEFFAALVRNKKTINPQEFSKLSLKERVILVSDLVPANNSTKSFGNACKSALKTFFLNSNEPSLSNVNKIETLYRKNFVPVFNDITKHFLENAEVILKELLRLGLMMLKKISLDDTTGEVFASILEFLWDTIKVEILKLNRRTEDKSIQIIIDICVMPLFNKIDILVCDWQNHLKLKYTQQFLGIA